MVNIFSGVSFLIKHVVGLFLPGSNGVYIVVYKIISEIAKLTKNKVDDDVLVLIGAYIKNSTKDLNESDKDKLFALLSKSNIKSVKDIRLEISKGNTVNVNTPFGYVKFNYKNSDISLK